MSGLSSENEEANDGGSHHSFRQGLRVEQDSSPRSLTDPSGFAQGDSAEERSQGPPEPKVPVTKGLEDKAL